MPLFNLELAQKLLTQLDQGAEAAIPRHGERTEPLFSAILRPAALNTATAMLQQDNRRLMDFFRQLNTSYLECQEEDFQFNLNRQEDYQSFLATYTTNLSSNLNNEKGNTKGDTHNE
jgi:molybdopterin-guanine dinucleotide biosynthesis protein A